MSSDEDEARLLAALTLAFHTAAAEAPADETFETKLARLGDAMVGQRWQITVARDLKLSVGSWLDHPWHCWKLRTLVRKLLAESLEPRREVEAVELLSRCAAMVEFGVDVNAAWYRRLREAVAERRVTQKKLRSLLRCPTVWWGTLRPGSGKPSSGSTAKFILGMGRPSEGELLIVDHHWTTKLLLTVLIVLSGTALAIVIVGFLGRLISTGSLQGFGPFIVGLYTYGMLFGAAWWFGPHSWSAVRQLRDVLKLDSNRR